jgi:hypothetical protein
MTTYSIGCERHDATSGPVVGRDERACGYARPVVRSLHRPQTITTTGAAVGLDEDPFTWQVTKDGRVLVFRSAQQVAVIAGAQADRLRPRLTTSFEGAQLALARATGNYRRGKTRGGGRAPERSAPRLVVQPLS